MVRSTYKSNLSTDEKVLMGIVRTAEIFKRAHAGVFKRHGLSFPQYNVLRVLEASANGRNTIGEVGRIMLVPGANMTGIAKRMEKQGFIRRNSDLRDERVTMLEITLKGRSVPQPDSKGKGRVAGTHARRVFSGRETAASPCGPETDPEERSVCTGKLHFSCTGRVVSTESEEACHENQGSRGP